jgi:20S proteasome alpha/beta subunit
MDGHLGFDFSLFAQNLSLASKGLEQMFTSAGTTIVAAVFDGGVVLVVGSRATPSSS